MATILSVQGKDPQFGENCFIAPNATIVGDVQMGDDCSIWFNAVMIICYLVLWFTAKSIQ